MIEQLCIALLDHKQESRYRGAVKSLGSQIFLLEFVL